MEISDKILLNYLEGDIGASELNELSKWIKESEENKQLFLEVHNIRILEKYNVHNNDIEVRQAFKKLDKTINKDKKRSNLWYFSRIAVSFVLFISLIGYGYHKWQNNEEFVTIVAGSDDAVKKIVLADNSTVWLKENAELRFSKSFNSRHRKVSLKGQAFFDIAKDENHPFMVEGNKATIKVVGTSFDLIVPPNSDIIETVLVTGQIVLQDNKEHDLVLLTPGEKAVFNTKENSMVIEAVDVNVLTSWRLEQTVFENETLMNIVEKLNEIYDTDIQIISEELKTKYFRFVVNKNEDIDEVINNLNYLTSIKVVRKDNNIFLDSK